MIVTAATSATPMVSAEAVMAVRPGARMALRRASMAAGPPVACTGRPRAPTTARTMRAGSRSRREVPAASRSASTGATRVARHAGTRPATSVTSTPTSSETTIVRVAKTVPVCGRSSPSALNSALMPLARPKPAATPTALAAAPMASASATTVRSTWRREAPARRSSPNSRERWATMIDSELKIVNAPTSSATPPKPSSTPLMIEMNPFRPSRV